MNSRLHPSFRRDFAKLTRDVQRFKTGPSHPGLQFKPLHTTLPLWSVHVTESYGAVGVRDGDRIVWFFIGTHAEYDRLLARICRGGA